MKLSTKEKKTVYHAVFSSCRRYRYEWMHRWSDGPYCLFIGLNPSTADEQRMDPTIRRCIGYAWRWGFGAVHIANLFAWRETDPDILKLQPHPVGAGNDAALRRLASGAGLIVAAWGTHGSHRNRAADVIEMLPRLHALRVNRDGSPAHPLYLPGALTPVEYP